MSGGMTVLCRVDGKEGSAGRDDSVVVGRVQGWRVQGGPTTETQVCDSAAADRTLRVASIDTATACADYSTTAQCIATAAVHRCSQKYQAVTTVIEMPAAASMAVESSPLLTASPCALCVLCSMC